MADMEPNCFLRQVTLTTNLVISVSLMSPFCVRPYFFRPTLAIL